MLKCLWRQGLPFIWRRSTLVSSFNPPPPLGRNLWPAGVPEGVSRQLEPQSCPCLLHLSCCQELSLSLQHLLWMVRQPFFFFFFFFFFNGQMVRHYNFTREGIDTIYVETFQGFISLWESWLRETRAHKGTSARGALGEIIAVLIFVNTWLILKLVTDTFLWFLFSLMQTKSLRNMRKIIDVYSRAWAWVSCSYVHVATANKYIAVFLGTFV